VCDVTIVPIGHLQSDKTIRLPNPANKEQVELLEPFKAISIRHEQSGDIGLETCKLRV